MFEFIEQSIKLLASIYITVLLVACLLNSVQGGPGPFELIGMLWRGEVKKK